MRLLNRTRRRRSSLRRSALTSSHSHAISAVCCATITNKSFFILQ